MWWGGGGGEGRERGVMLAHCSVRSLTDKLVNLRESCPPKLGGAGKATPVLNARNRAGLLHTRMIIYLPDIVASTSTGHRL